jgi:xylulose-5-phosphate/fructose-6-phosphate phosphoketolase
MAPCRTGCSPAPATCRRWRRWPPPTCCAARTNHKNLHVRGYKEEGTTTTPFDMVMLNDLDRYHLVIDVIDRVPDLRTRTAHLRQSMVDARRRCRDYRREHGEDAPEVAGWRWDRPEAETNT